jgi:hypothetical protein
MCVLLFKTLKQLSVGTAFDAWTGIGSVEVVVGRALFDDPVTAVRIGCIVDRRRRLRSVPGWSGSTWAARGPPIGTICLVAGSA